MTTAKDLALEVLKISAMGTLRRAVLSETVSDVIGVHRSVLEARIGHWTSEVERAAVSLLDAAVNVAMETADFQDYDDAEIEQDDIRERIEAMADDV